jgi:hypothetical protein
MKKNILLAFIACLPVFGFSQVKQLVVEEIDNGGNVKGRTYRIYAEMTNVKDQIYVVYGDSINPLKISSTKPFYQHKYGGAFSRDSNRKQVSEDKQLKYDSWLTIGAEDNYNNNVQFLNLDFNNFEVKGSAIEIPKDGAWFCIPTDKQAWCGEDKRILLMQLTSDGQIIGTINIMGKTYDGNIYQKQNMAFSCGETK